MANGEMANLQLSVLPHQPLHLPPISRETAKNKAEKKGSCKPMSRYFFVSDNILRALTQFEQALQLRFAHQLWLLLKSSARTSERERGKGTHTHTHTQDKPK